MPRAPGVVGLRARTARMQHILDEVQSHPYCFDFTADRLGEDVCHLAAAAILDRMGEERDPDGVDWAPLSEAYAEWKAARVGGEPISVLYHRMRTIEQLTGECDITPARIVQVYGLDDEAKAEAAWFSEGDDNQPARPFYALNDEALKAIDEWLDAVFAKAVDG